MRERWRSIEGHPGYEVSDHGRVRSLDRRVICIQGEKVFTRFFPGRILAIRPKHGYSYTQLGRVEEPAIHRLVGKAFVKGDSSLDINHKDGNRSNNYYKNLEWSTRSQNIKHSYDTLGRRSIVAVAIVMGDLQFESISAAARHYGASISSVFCALRDGHRCRGQKVYRVISR